MLLNEIGYHVQLSKIDGENGDKFMFPVNTSDDVIIDETGTTLKNFIPSITTNLEQHGSPMKILETSTEEIDDNILQTIINA